MIIASLPDLTEIVDRCGSGIAAILRQSVAPEERAGGLADLLRELLPETARTACLLRGEGGDCLAVRPGSERPVSELESSLRSHLSSLPPLAARVQPLPAETLAGLHGLAAAIHEDGRAWGFLVVGLPAEAPPAVVARAEAVLTVAAPTVALRWLLDALQRERAEQARFALVGQAFAGLAHDLNNALNSMMLQTSVVQLRVDPQVRQELAAIRQHGAQAAGLVRSLQHVIQERREQSSDIDLHSVLTELLSEDAELRRRVVPRLGTERPRIHSTRGAAKQLLRLLLEGVSAASQAAVNAETSVQDGGAVLELTIPAVTIDLDSNDAQAASEALLWQNLDEVGRLAGQSLLRQLGGVITSEHRQDTTLILRIIWQPSA